MNVSSSDGMLAAVAGADITPAPGLVLQGHWSERPSHGVLFPLEVRALVFRDGGGQSAVLITLDVMAVSRQTSRRIGQAVEQRSGIPASRVMVVASHTHCAPAMLLALGIRPDADYLERVEGTSIQCVLQAVEQLEPVTLGLGGASACFNTNRRPLPGTTAMAVNAEGLVDRRARFLRVDRVDGSPLAVLFHYSCHPTIVAGSQGLISPDYAGVARSVVESTLGCHALFLQGCCGNVRPLIVDEQGKFKAGSKEELEAIGQTLGKAVARAADAVRTSRHDDLEMGEVDVDFRFGPPPSVEELEAQLAQTTPLAIAVTAPWAKDVLERLKAGTLPTSERSKMQSVRIGPLILMAIPGEPVQEIGHAVERSVLAVTDAQEVWPVGYANDMLGYLVTDRQHSEGGYEPNAYPYYGRPAPWRDEQAMIIAHALKLVQRQAIPVVKHDGGTCFGMSEAR